MITDRKITAWEKPVSAEADRPQRTAAELKAVFDGNSEQLKSSVNGLIDDLTGSAGAENIGSPSLPGIEASGLWAQIAAFFAKVFGIVKTDQPSNRYLNGAGQYTVPSVGAAANGLPLGGSDNDFLLKNGAPDYATKWQAAAGVRARLNVADGADNTSAAAGISPVEVDIDGNDHLLMHAAALKRVKISTIIGFVKTALFGLTSGIIKLNEGVVSAATAGVDYATPEQMDEKTAPGLLVAGLTLPTSGWAGSGPYTKTFTVAGAVTTESARYILFPSWTAQRTNERTAWNLIEDYVITSTDTLTITVLKVPSTAVSFSLKEVV